MQRESRWRCTNSARPLWGSRVRRRPARYRTAPVGACSSTSDSAPFLPHYAAAIPFPSRLETTVPRCLGTVPFTKLRRPPPRPSRLAIG
ncbi:hypothetical protein chiPu_0016347 [Chiloscyllium punctatum]|uniref:Uncharacterized protein n=1 Tax=Chiloscyllium punctatum TaxID=137246 RepID=A0A401T5C8_CHIPU|nr:hypothetical protein [Chiloscyllium punctatum]